MGFTMIRSLRELPGSTCRRRGGNDGSENCDTYHLSVMRYYLSIANAVGEVPIRLPATE